MSVVAKRRIIILACIEIILFLLLRPDKTDDVKMFFLLCIFLCVVFILLNIWNSSLYIPIIKKSNSHLTGDIIEKELKFSDNANKFLNINPVIFGYVTLIIINIIIFVVFYLVEKLI